MLVWRGTLQLVGNPGHRLVPGEDAVVRITRPGVERLRQPSAPLQLARRESPELVQAERAEKVGAEGALHVGDHGLKRLLTHLRPVASFVPHPPGLAAHAQAAGLARVLGPHGAPEPSPAHALSHAKRVPDGGPAAAAGRAGHTSAPGESPPVDAALSLLIRAKWIIEKARRSQPPIGCPTAFLFRKAAGRT